VDANDPKITAKDTAADAPGLQSLQGRWRLTHFAGTHTDDAKIGRDFLFRGGRLKILWRDVDDIARPCGPTLLNTAANPKQIVFFNDDACRAQSGIYRLDKDRLEICWDIDDRDEKGIPSKFEVGNDSKTIQLIQLERVDAVAEQAAADKTRLIQISLAATGSQVSARSVGPKQVVGTVRGIDARGTVGASVRGGK